VSLVLVTPASAISGLHRHEVAKRAEFDR